MTLTGRMRERAYARAVAERGAAYAATTTEDERRSWQLSRLNREWQRALSGVPHYRRLQSEAGLPEAFRSLEEFVERVPPSARSDVQRDLAARSSTERPAEFRRMTGGSTSRPLQIPAWRSEVRDTRPDTWIGRGWYGITPSSRLFTLWGHAHLLGTGLRGFVQARKRELLDRLLGYRRFSAYDLRAETLQEAGHALLRSRADYVLGYAVALDRFARANLALRDRIRALGLRAVVATAESFPSADSPDRLRDLFGCPVAMEYGAVETGLLAHTHPDGGFRVFWRSYLLEAERGADGSHVLRVTALFPRCFPLLRYELGDEVEPWEAAPDRIVGLSRLRRVIGRCNDYVELADGSRIHSEAFSHAIRPCAAIRGFQVAVGGDRLRIRVVSDAELAPDAEKAILGRLHRVHRDLGRAELVRVEKLDQTVAGKTRMVVHDEPVGPA